MKPSLDLYYLIKSLTKAEKSYFRKFASRHIIGNKNKYLRLYEEISNINSSAEYDENDIKAKFPKEKFIESFPVIKNYLFEIIMKSLNSFYSDSTADFQIKSNVRNIEILYKKALYDKCKKMLNKAFKQAYKYDNYIQILELIKLKKNLIHEGAYGSNEYENLEKAYREEKDILNIIHNLNEYRLLSYKARSIMNLNTKNETKKNQKFQELNLHPLLLSHSCALSFPALISFYHVKAFIYEHMNEPKKVLECRLKLVKLMESQPERIKDNPTNYVVLLYNLIYTCSSLKIYQEFNRYLLKLRSVENEYPDKISENLKILIFMGPYNSELRMYCETGQFEKGYEKLGAVERGLNRYEGKINKTDENYCYYLMAYINFGLKKYDESLRWINKILNDRTNAPENSMVVNSKILSLIIHYELENFDYLEYLIKSTYRYLKKIIKINKTQKLIINFLRKIPDAASRNEVATLFTEAKDKMIEIYKARNNEELSLDLVSWLESKIDKRNFSDIVRKKYLEKAHEREREI